MSKQNIGAIIKRSRNHIKMTQQELANLCGVDVTYLSKIENNHVLPSRNLCIKLAPILEIEINELNNICGYTVPESRIQQIVVNQREKIALLEDENKRLKLDNQYLKKVLDKIKQLIIDN